MTFSLRTLTALQLLCLAAVATSAQAAEMPRTISISAKGTVTAVPDMALIRAGVVTEAASAAEALRANSVSMRKVLDGLRGARVAEKDIQTSQLNVQPRYDRPKDGSAPHITGYQVTNQVVVVVRDLGSLGALVDKVVSLGANRFDGIQFEVSGFEKKKDEARREAMSNAIRMAKLYAEAGGTSLGPVLQITEGVRSPSGPVVYGRARAAAMEAPVAPGELELEVEVHVTWSLK